MIEKEFYLDDGTYVVQVSHYEPFVPGKFSGPPENCYPEEGAEVEFESKVDFASDEDETVTEIEFDDFVKRYAAERTKGNERKALDEIESETISDIVEQTGEYEP